MILSDENERSFGGKLYAQYALAERDLPETLVLTTKVKMPAKTFSVHPIVVQSALTRAGGNDVACNVTQNNEQSGIDFDRYGTLYEELAVAGPGLQSLQGGLVKGSAGSICDTNYTPTVQKIGDSINKNLSVIQLACNPTDLKVTLGGQVLNSSEYSVNGSNHLTLKVPPACKKLDLSYKCPRNI